MIALNSNDLSLMIAQKSERGILSILTKSPQSINESNQLRQTPLHLAVGWSFGVNVLIRNGANLDPVDGYGNTPLSYALAYGFAETVGLLMKAGSNLSTSNHYNYLKKAIMPCIAHPKCVSNNASMKRHKATLTKFVTSLAERRRRLHGRLAAAPISGGINACWAENDRVLDEHASCAEDALRYYENAPPEASTCLSDLRTFYHESSLTVEIAEELWQAGFHDVDACDENHETPLSQRGHTRAYDLRGSANEIEFLNWLVERGANIYSPIRCRQSHSEATADFTTLHPERRALHEVAASIGRNIIRRDLPGFAARRNGICCIQSHECNRCILVNKINRKSSVEFLSDLLNRVSESSRRFMAMIFLNPSSDGCLCACSSRGCTTSSILHKSKAKSWSLQPTRCWMMLLGPHITCEDWLIDEIIRFNTFEKLQLKHTCCTHFITRSRVVFQELEPDEVNEFRSEDSEGIKLLEELMIEFRDKRGKQDIMTFLEGYWTTRMRKTHRTRGTVDFEKTREMGIVWEKKDLA